MARHSVNVDLGENGWGWDGKYVLNWLVAKNPHIRTKTLDTYYKRMFNDFQTLCNKVQSYININVRMTDRNLFSNNYIILITESSKLVVEVFIL